jgi:hypothetical protein
MIQLLKATVFGVSLSFVCLLSAAAGQAPAIGGSATARSATNRNEAPAAGPFQGLVRATSTQIQLAYRNNEQERAHRREQVAAAVADWRAAGPSAANDRLLTEWLRESIRKSMPGSREPLPELPKFERPIVARPATTATTPLATTLPSLKSSPSTTVRQKPVVANARPARRSRRSTPSAAAQSLGAAQRTGNAATMSDAPAPTTKTAIDAASERGQRDFWSAHPASSDLPADLTGDPFRDDP